MPKKFVGNGKSGTKWMEEGRVKEGEEGGVKEGEEGGLMKAQKN